jgi:hypothetical protein
MHHLEVCEYITDKILVGKTEWKRSFRKPKHDWNDNTTTDIKYDVRLWTGHIYHGIG